MISYKLTDRSRGMILAVVAPGVLTAFFATGCHKPVAAADTDDAGDGAASMTAAADVDGGEVGAPPPVVAADPNIPLNEAVVGTAPVPADYFAMAAPPAPVEEDKPESPDAADVWVPGYWWWSVPLNRYVWVAGAWRNPPPGEVWTMGQWAPDSSGHYYWTPGFWGAPNTPRPLALDVAPPVLREEVELPSPGFGYSWTPGYYGWRENAYVWMPGAWVRPPAVGVLWVSPTYTFIGGHYYFSPGRWDHPPAARGVVYRPDIDVRPGMAFHPAPVPMGLVVAHAGFVAAAGVAISLGGMRTASGGYSVHAGVNASVGAGGAPGGRGAPSGGAHGGPGGMGSEHVAPNVAGGEHVAPGGGSVTTSVHVAPNEPPGAGHGGAPIVPANTGHPGEMGHPEPARTVTLPEHGGGAPAPGAHGGGNPPSGAPAVGSSHPNGAPPAGGGHPGGPPPGGGSSHGGGKHPPEKK